MHLAPGKEKKKVCCLLTAIQNCATDWVEARGSASNSTELETMATDSLEPSSLEASVCANVSSCVCVNADGMCNVSRLIASMNVSCLWCLNVTHAM